MSLACGVFFSCFVVTFHDVSHLGVASSHVGQVLHGSSGWPLHACVSFGDSLVRILCPFMFYLPFIMFSYSLWIYTCFWR